MCLFKAPSPPKLAPLPTAPNPDDDAVRRREMEEAARLAASSGTAGTVKTDLAPSAVSGSQRRISLGM